MIQVKEKFEKFELQFHDITCWKACYVFGIYTRMHYTRNWGRTFFSSKYIQSWNLLSNSYFLDRCPYYTIILYLFYDHATQEGINA